MRSTILLLKTCRRRLLVCLFIEVVVSFVSGLNGSHIQLAGISDIMDIPFMLAAVMGLYARYASRFNALPFPITVRQRAWMPMLEFMILWASGGVAVLAAFLYQSFVLSNILGAFFSTLPVLPLYILGYLLGIRFVRTKPHLAGFILLGMTFMNSNDSSSSFFLMSTYWSTPLMSNYHIWWPVVIAGIVFYLYEAPIMIAHRDRLLVGQTNNGQLHPFGMPDTQIIWRPHAAVYIAETVEAILLFFAILIGIRFGYSHFFVNSGLFAYFGTWGPVIVPSLLFTLFLFLIFIPLCKGQYYFTTASGFSPASALGMTVMEMTLILNPLTQALGVKKGVIAVCNQCHMKKFLWAPHCPHCGNPGSGTAANKRVARVVEGKSPVVQWKLRVFRGVFIPLQFFFIFGLVGIIGQRPFVTYSDILVFHDKKDIGSHERAVAQIKELIAKHPDPVTWLNAAKPSEDSAPRVPEKFRLKVEVLGEVGISVSGYCLRWDLAQELTAAIALLLAEDIEEVNSTDTKNQSFHSRSSPLFQTRTYLDNQMHWVEPKE